MKIEIDIDDRFVTLLSRWASVSRTLSTAIKGCNVAGDGDVASDTDQEIFRYCANELHDLRPALDQLHTVARQAIWKINAERRVAAAMSKTTPEQRAMAREIVQSTPYPLHYDNINRVCDILGVDRALDSAALVAFLRKEVENA